MTARSSPAIARRAATAWRAASRAAWAQLGRARRTARASNCRACGPDRDGRRRRVRDRDAGRRRLRKIIMKKNGNKILACCVSCAAMLFAALPVCAQPYPSKPIRHRALRRGGPSDLFARAVGSLLTEAWTQPVIIDIVLARAATSAYWRPCVRLPMATRSPPSRSRSPCRRPWTASSATTQSKTWRPFHCSPSSTIYSS